jgi:hypothetical protein
MHSELDRVRNIVSFFGLSFIAGGFSNSLKAYFLIKYIDFVESQPFLVCLFSFLSSILIELGPIMIIYNMHITNF